MTRLKKILIFSLFPIVCITTTLLMAGCDSIGVSSNLGARLDSMGKAVPMAYKTGQYTLNGKLYTECEVAYQQFETPIIEFSFGHLVYTAEHNSLPPDAQAPPPTRYLLAREGYEVIPAADFDYTHATGAAKPKSLNPIPSAYCCHFRTLSADYNPHPRKAQVNFLPEQRSTGNRLRTPLVATISWGVDVPLTLIGNAVLYTITGALGLVSLLIP